MATSFILAFTLLFAPIFSREHTRNAPESAPAPAAATAIGGADPVDVLGQWIKLYRQGRLDLTGSKRRLRGRRATMRKKDFITITSGLFADQDPVRWSHQRELERLCGVVAELKSAAAAIGLLEIAAVGLDRRDYTPTMNPVVVRRIGEKHLAALVADSRQHVLDAATTRSTKMPIRAAAMRALGMFQDELYRQALENGLADRAARLRLAAAQGLARSELKTAVPALARQLTNEPDGAARIAMIDALTAIATRHGAEVAERDRRRAVSAVLDGLGRFDWSADLAALDYLRQVRSADTVPGLIRLLSAYASEGRIRKDASKSSLVPYRAHELLVSLTGAVFPANQPTQWQSWWDEVRDTFTLAQPAPLAERAGEGKRTGASSFFGVPVRGTRVLFVVDVSGSMLDSWGSGDSKLDVARRELKKAVGGMVADSAFNLVAFGDRAGSWRDKLMAATKGNKDSFFKYVDKLQIGESTNVWAGLQRALKMETVEQDARYATQADEIFVLSDGAPTVGDIVRPEQILLTVTETNRISRVRINTIYIEGEDGGRGRRGRGGRGRRGRRDGEPRMSGAELMKLLAEQNGGRFLQPKPPKK